MDNNIPDYEFLPHLAGETNNNLLYSNMGGDIPDPEFLARLAGETNQTLEGMEELEPQKKIPRKRSKYGASSGGGTKSIKTVGAGVADGIVGIFIPCRNRTGTLILTMITHYFICPYQ